MGPAGTHSCQRLRLSNALSVHAQARALPSLRLFSLGLKNLESTLREVGGACRLGSAATAPKSFMQGWDRPSGTEGIFIDYIERITMVRERSRVPTGSGQSCGDCGSWAWLPLSLWAAAYIAFNN